MAPHPRTSLSTSSSLAPAAHVAGAEPVAGAVSMDPAARQRRQYEQVVSHSDGAFVSERPPLFSPAVAVQDAAAGKPGLHQWAAMFLHSEYTDWVDESRAHAESCYLGDWSALSKTIVRGPQALKFMSWLGMANLSAFELGQCKHHVQLDEHGWVASEGVICRLGEDELLYTAGSSEWLRWQIREGGWNAQANDITPDQFIFGVQGPASLFVVERATGESLRDISFADSRGSQIDGIPVRILRVGISGELGYELHGPAELGGAAWASLRNAGEPFAIRQLGGRAQSVQHIEAGIATNGLDYIPASAATPGAPKLFRRRAIGGSFVPTAFPDYFRKPGELAWGPRDGSIPAHDFLGRESLLADAQAGGPARTLVGLVWNPDDVIDVFAAPLRDTGDIPDQMDIPRRLGPAFDQVLVDGERVGVSSGRTLSVNVRAMISLCVIDRSVATPGTDVVVIWGRPGTQQRQIRANVVSLPFKADRRRTDVTTLAPAAMSGDGAG